MQNSKLVFWSVINSLGTFVYIVLVALLLNNANRLFGPGPADVLGAVAMLLLLVLSATITGGLVLGRPAYLYFNSQKAEAVKLFFYTIGCLFAVTILVFLGFILIR